jgi:hypothetical protein
MLLIFLPRAAHSHDLSLSLKLIRLRLLTVARLTFSVQLDLYASAVDQIEDLTRGAAHRSSSAGHRAPASRELMCLPGSAPTELITRCPLP